MSFESLKLLMFVVSVLQDLIALRDGFNILLPKVRLTCLSRNSMKTLQINIKQAFQLVFFCFYSESIKKNKNKKNRTFSLN